jgi:rhamnosyltransferase
VKSACPRRGSPRWSNDAKMHGVPSLVTVAIPTLNAGPDFTQTLTAVRAQRLDREIELLVCDSGSLDETVSLSRSYGAEVLRIPPGSFSHGGTRNVLMGRARGTHVAFLTQDAVPATEHWLAELLEAFTLAQNVGLAFGPYQARPGASPSVVRELTSWFDSFSVGGPRIDVLDPADTDAPPRHFLGQLGFFTDANGCVARAAWERVPFRPVAYAEDHLLAQDMLRAGFAKVYVPAAAVIHSHEYSLWQWLRRSFDEARAIREVYGFALDPRSAARNVRGGVMADSRWARASRPGPGQDPGPGSGGGLRWEQIPGLIASLAHHGARATGTLLGAHAGCLPPSIAARLSLEGRAGTVARPRRR